MRFVPITKAKGLKIGEEMFTVNSKGEHGIAKLVSRVEKANSTEVEFEVPQYFNPDAPAINPVLTKDVAFVCRIKDRKPEEDATT